MEPTDPTSPPQLSSGRGERAFAVSALKLAGLAGVLLGWRPGEFWAATPAELAAMLSALGEEPGGATGDDLRRLSEMFPD